MNFLERILGHCCLQLLTKLESQDERGLVYNYTPYTPLIYLSAFFGGTKGASATNESLANEYRLSFTSHGVSQRLQCLCTGQ